MGRQKEYTQNWFDRRIPVWEQTLNPFKGLPELNFLEIGSYEGRSACWLMDNILTNPNSTLTCLDIFNDASSQGSWSNELYREYDMSAVYQRFLENTEEYREKCPSRLFLIQGRSGQSLRKFNRTEMFDCIYIDGSHIAADVLEDIVLSWPLLKINGILILDDYLWSFFEDPKRHPKIAIDAFLSIFEGRYDTLHQNHQVIIRKTIGDL